MRWFPPKSNPYFFQRHSILDEQCDAGVQVSHILFQHEILFRLWWNPRLQVPQVLLCCRRISATIGDQAELDVPRAKSSEISKSRSFADMDRYRAVTDIRLDWRSDRVSCDDIVFCRATGWNEEEEEEDARDCLDAGWSIVATDIVESEVTGRQKLAIAMPMYVLSRLENRRTPKGKEETPVPRGVELPRYCGIRGRKESSEKSQERGGGKGLRVK